MRTAYLDLDEALRSASAADERVEPFGTQRRVLHPATLL